MCAAQGGAISFRLALTGTRLVLINAGDGVAFYPGAMLMRADGVWETMSPRGGQQAPSQLAPGERMELALPDTRPLEKLSAVERLRPTMVHFHDQAGVGFGQISLFTTPPPASAKIPAHYAGGILRLAPPSDDAIHATWVLWPQEEGIAGIRQAFKSELSQPPAKRIEWSADSRTFSVLTGAGLPAVTLIHETAQGYQLQHVASGWRSGQQQRSIWLEANQVFYAFAQIFLMLALGAALWSWRQSRRGAASA